MNSHKTLYSFDSLDGTKSAWPYQCDGIRFAERRPRTLIADDMGLGKTVQAALWIRRNMDAISPVLWITPPSVMNQTIRELREWVADDVHATIPLVSPMYFVPGFKIYVLSIDMLGRKPKKNRKTGKITGFDVVEALKRIPFRAIVLDECQGYANISSGRTEGLFELTEHFTDAAVLALSGTPISNFAAEGYPVFHVLNGTEPGFESEAAYIRKYLTPDGKRIRNGMLPQYKHDISQFVIRREKSDVMADLPELRRDVRFVTVDDPVVRKSYNDALDLMDNMRRTKARDGERLSSQKIIGWLSQLRHITGQAKLPAAVEFAHEFLDSTGRPLLIGAHHELVLEGIKLAFEFNGLTPPAVFNGSTDSLKKAQLAEDFNSGRLQCLAMNMISGGVGLNLQGACSDILQVEMLWNAAREDQFLARVHRAGQKNAVQATTLIAEGTIDQWFHELKKDKRAMFKDAIAWDSEEQEAALEHETETSGFLKELAEITLSHRL